MVAEKYLAAACIAGTRACWSYARRCCWTLLATGHPASTATLRAIAAERERLRERWASLPTIAIDYAVAEPAAAAGRVTTVPVGFGWDDIGDFDSLTIVLDQAATAAA